MAKQQTYRTAVQDLIDWIDRVEERGITQLSTAKIRERLAERLPIEKDRMNRFVKEFVEVETGYMNDAFVRMFPTKNTDQ